MVLLVFMRNMLRYPTQSYINEVLRLHSIVHTSTCYLSEAEHLILVHSLVNSMSD
jgi:hypothetical protein